MLRMCKMLWQLKNNMIKDIVLILVCVYEVMVGVEKMHYLVSFPYQYCNLCTEEKLIGVIVEFDTLECIVDPCSSTLLFLSFAYSISICCGLCRNPQNLY